MRRRMIALLFVLSGIVTAQDPPNDPVFDLLDAIPDLRLSREVITLVDRDAIPLAYPDAVKPATLDELLAADTRAYGVFWKVFSQLGDATAQGFSQSDTLPDRLGIEFMQISKTATFGRPPDNGVVLAGAFDTAIIESTLAARDYSATENNGWCYQGDCANGSAVNPDQREISDPFGGNLGRNQPIVVTDTLLISSPNEVIPEAAQELQQGYYASLADDNTYQAVSQVLSAEGIVLQATFVDAETLLQTSMRDSGEPLDESAGFAPIAPYALYAFADVVTESEQVGITAFVYESEDDATAALEQMQFRLGVLESLATGQSWQALLDERTITLSTSVVPVNNLFVGILRFSTPKATTEDILASSGEVVQPGLIYLRLLYNSFVQQDQQWRLWE